VEKSAGGGYAAFYDGPVLLAAKLGDDGLKKEDFYADGSVPFIQLGRKEMDQAKVPAVARDGGASLLHKSKSGYALKTSTGEMQLVPFYQVGLERYSVYFPLR